MRRFHKIPISLFGIVLLFFFFQNASAQYAIPRSVFGSGGTPLSSSDNKLVGTLGQTFVGTTSGAYNKQFAGFWQVQRSLFTSVHEKSAEGLPTEYQLEQNYPNPFNPRTIIEFATPKKSQVSIKIYNMLGEEAATLVSGQVEAGFYSATWNASSFPSGVYFYQLRTEKFVETKKLMLLR